MWARCASGKEPPREIFINAFCERINHDPEMMRLVVSTSSFIQIMNAGGLSSSPISFQNNLTLENTPDGRMARQFYSMCRVI